MLFDFTHFVSVPPKKPEIRDRFGNRLTGKMGPYKVGDEVLVTCTTTGGT